MHTNKGYASYFQILERSREEWDFPQWCQINKILELKKKIRETRERHLTSKSCDEL